MPWLFCTKSEPSSLFLRKIGFLKKRQSFFFPSHLGRNKQIHIDAFIVMVIDGFSIFGMILESTTYTTPERIFFGAIQFMRAGK